jgi:acyl-CoA reductase-like NAD-dependent aldehyde dehydrogenase
VGDPEERETQVGPAPTAERRAEFLRFVEDSGGTLLLGGKQPSLPEAFGAGFFVSPTLLSFESFPAQVPPPGMPLACLVPFDGTAELLQLVNNSVAFTAASLWTKDISRAHTLARSLKAGTVVVNAWSLSDPGHPLGGAKRAARAEANLLAAFSETQTIRIKL